MRQVCGAASRGPSLPRVRTAYQDTPVGYYSRLLRPSHRRGSGHFHRRRCGPGILSALLPGFLGFYAALAALVGIGYLIGQGVNRVVSGKRGRGLQWVAGVAMGITAFIAWALYRLQLLRFDHYCRRRVPCRQPAPHLS